MFSATMRIIRKGKIKAEVQSELQKQAANGLFTLDAFTVAAGLVDSIWARIPDALDGKLGAKPTKEVIAVVALANALDSDYDWGSNRDGLIAAFISAASKLNHPNHRFTQIDTKLMEGVEPVLQKIKNEIESSPMAKEVNQLMGRG